MWQFQNKCYFKNTSWIFQIFHLTVLSLQNNVKQYSKKIPLWVHCPVTEIFVGLWNNLNWKIFYSKIGPVFFSFSIWNKTYLPYTLCSKTYTQKGIYHFLIGKVCVIPSLNDFVSCMCASRQACSWSVISVFPWWFQSIFSRLYSHSRVLILLHSLCLLKPSLVRWVLWMLNFAPPVEKKERVKDAQYAKW